LFTCGTRTVINFFLEPGAEVLNYCPTGWSEPAATSAPVQDEAVQAVLWMNQKHILFPCPGIFQPPSLPQTCPLLPTSPPPFASLLPPSTHFPLTPSPELKRTPEVELKRTPKLE